MAKNVHQLKEKLDKYCYRESTTRVYFRPYILQLGIHTHTHTHKHKMAKVAVDGPAYCWCNIGSELAKIGSVSY